MKKIIVVLAIALAQGFLKAQNVNQFNGSFNYEVPLLYLPSDRGDGVNISASYNSGIPVHQSASEIGLGWSINSEAAIYRSVSGYPDDMLNYQVQDMVNGNTLSGQGALYTAPSIISNTINYDFNKTQKGPGLDTTEFITPAFDMFSVKAPAFGGQMKLSYHKFYSYHSQNMSSTQTPDYRLVPNTQNLTTNNFPGSLYFRKPQFHFTGDFADTLTSRHYSTTINSSTPFRIPTDLVNQLGYPGGSFEPFIGKHLNGATVSNQNYDPATGRLASSNFIEYFTNQEINAANTSSFSSGPLSTFIDFSSSHARSSSSFPDEGIGYFRITASNGLTYHYSLPVYEYENIVYNAPLNNDYSIPSQIAPGSFTYSGSGASEPYPVTNSSITIKYTNTNRYAVKWLLTAITGRDYVDVNNNHVVDDNDQGYWLSYDYQLWSSNFVKRSPQYGFEYQFSPDDKNQRFPIYYPTKPLGTGSHIKLTGLIASANVTRSEVYYLSKIRTSSHTLVFVMDSRKDEKGGNETDYIASNFKPTPGLLVKRLVLFNNSDLNTVLGSHSNAYNQSNFSNSSSFNFTNINTNSSFYTESWFQQVIPSGNNYILKNIEFDQDYSLCSKYHGNIEVTCPSSSPVMSPSDVQNNLTVSNSSSSGKLTLKRILTYDLHNVKVTPSVMFDYQSGLTNGNPDFNPVKTDYWGYYKADATQNGFSGYTNSVSKDFTKAWCLDKITDPLGGITQIEYESNRYNKVIDAEKGTRGPVFIYRIKDVNALSNANFDIMMEEGSNSNYPLSEFLSLVSNTLTGLNKTICFPFSKAEDPAGTSVSSQYNGFLFGACSLTVNGGGSNNPSDNITGNFVSNKATVYTDLSTSNPDFYNLINFSNFTNPIQQSWNMSLGNYDIAYSGGGFIMFEAPIGYETYGWGARVKSIKRKNSPTEIYDEEYTYENGVACSEMDRFDFQVPKMGRAGSPLRYGYLRPKSYTLMDLPPSIGYKKVTVKNPGRITTPNSTVETTFITDPADESGLFSQNYSMNSVLKIAGNNDVQQINECTNKFSSLFGATKQVIVYDKNSNIVSKTVNQYTPTEQGALVENLHFEDPNYNNATVLSSTVNILRDVPVVLKSTTHYDMGTFKNTETLVRDEWTGEGTTIKSNGVNKSTSMAYKVPAYKQYLAAFDFTTAASRVMLPYSEDLFTYANIDTTLSQAQGNGYSSSFLNASYKLYSRVVRKLTYSSVSNTFSATQVTLPYYTGNRRFQFDAGTGSMNEYGLLKKSKLDSNGLNLSTINNSAIWEPLSGTYNWRLTQEITLMIDPGHILESRDANDRFSANRYAYNNYYANATVRNCNYSSFTFADFENPANSVSSNGTYRLDGDILTTSCNLVNSSSMVPHTGSKCIAVSTSPLKFTSSSEKSSGNTLDLGLLPGRIYRASVWTHSTNLANASMEITVSGAVNGTTSISNFSAATSASNLVTTIGNWNLLQIDFEVPEGFSTGSSGQFKIELKSNGGTVYFDDFLFHPVESDFGAKVYDPQSGRVISTLDANGMATNFVYDASGKTIEVWKEIPHATSTTGTYKKVKSNIYNYARGANN